MLRRNLQLFRRLIQYYGMLTSQNNSLFVPVIPVLSCTLRESFEPYLHRGYTAGFLISSFNILVEFSEIGKRRVVTSASSGWGWPQGSSCWEDLSQQLRTPCRRRIWQLLQERHPKRQLFLKGYQFPTFRAFNMLQNRWLRWFWYIGIGFDIVLIMFSAQQTCP